MCRQAMRLGFSHACPTEHADFHPPDPCYGRLDMVTYSRALAACRQKFAGQMVVLQGIEVDYQSRYDGAVRAFLAQHSVDFAIGSTHYADGHFVVDALLEAYDADTAYRRYFQAVRETAASGLFDVLGHLDLLKRYGIPRWGSYSRRPYVDDIEAILQAAVGSGTGLEINTSGLRQAPAETFPDLHTLRRYRELGGEIVTLGSDAHQPAHVGQHIHQGLALAQVAGFKAIAVFIERTPHWLDIKD